MDLKTPVSIRQFAKMVGRAESAVRKARDRQSISEGVTTDGKLIPEIAAREWGVEILPKFGGQPAKLVSVKKPDIGNTDTVVKRDTPKLVKIVKEKKPARKPALKKQPTTADEFVEEMMHELSVKITQEEVDNFDDEEEGEISEGTTKVEAERRIAIYKAKMAELAYKEKQKQLVDVSVVNTALFSFGAEIRSAVEGITNRSIDKILAVGSRHEAKRILDEEIYDTLNLLADISSRELI